MLDRIFPFVDSPDIGHPGAGMQGGGEIGQPLRRASRVDFHIAVIEVSCPPTQAKGRGLVLNKEAESYALHGSPHDPAFCGFLFHH